MDVQIHEAAKSDFPTVSNLVRFYIYDMSEHMGWSCTVDGLFGGCDDLPKYWDDPRCHAFLLKSAEELAGFAMIDGHPNEPAVDYRVGEFFVLRKFRRQGVGMKIAHQLFDRFHGRWSVEQLARNAPALCFWRKTISGYTEGKFLETTAESTWGVKNVILFDNTWNSEEAGRHVSEK